MFAFVLGVFSKKPGGHLRGTN
uniref:Uncharacterized protein n=1 Tax=Anguilla anguilla TaxID=7936 RepID=A0A0E9VKD1_ANGAN